MIKDYLLVMIPNKDLDKWRKKQNKTKQNKTKQNKTKQNKKNQQTMKREIKFFIFLGR